MVDGSGVDNSSGGGEPERLMDGTEWCVVMSAHKWSGYVMEVSWSGRHVYV